MQLLIKDVKMVRGIMLLSPASVVVKGHAVEELEEHAETTVEASLRARLGYVRRIIRSRTWNQRVSDYLNAALNLFKTLLLATHRTTILLPNNNNSKRPLPSSGILQPTTTSLRTLANDQIRNPAFLPLALPLPNLVLLNPATLVPPTRTPHPPSPLFPPPSPLCPPPSPAQPPPRVLPPPPPRLPTSTISTKTSSNSTRMRSASYRSLSGRVGRGGRWTIWTGWTGWISS